MPYSGVLEVYDFQRHRWFSVLPERKSEKREATADVTCRELEYPGAEDNWVSVARDSSVLLSVDCGTGAYDSFLECNYELVNYSTFAPKPIGITCNKGNITAARIRMSPVRYNRGLNRGRRRLGP